MSDEKTIHIPDFRKAIFQIGGGTLVMIALFFWAVSGWVRAWHFDAFPSRSEFIEAIEAINRNEENVSTLTLELRLGNAISRVDNLKSSIFLAEQQAKNYGITPDMEKAKADLKRSLERAEAYRDCLISDKTNCELLRFAGQ